ncbi:TetR/AcrR family transcriptional regulator [Cellulophaga sp. HaHaR_3_176]|uniref:TetR/AcrR family transcriptional regulator n=1 Tax=Cellulophaga sp. HaHaR_3_176 TaxID=1942464 RepID=UPI001C1FC9C5|nr:TetR/AcrR family transcriptional regulator [Cellulophaga sp. HaHaR_3_176]QWX83826.1 TetR/AcrR family transcriptional regulator [Cellulophaga sp. HaHaR_3_176]
MKEKILTKASEMFLNLGFKSVTMDDLANELGISKKTIYTHFENKTKLVEESSLYLLKYISNGIDCIIETDRNPIEELYEIKKFVMKHLNDEQSSPQYQLQKYYPKVYATIKSKQYDVMQECVVSNIKKGIEIGIYRENINIEFISRIYFSGVTSIKDYKLFPIKLFPVKQLQDDFLEYHLRGITTPDGRKILNTLINSNQE